MRLLDRYLLRELMIPLAYCLAGFLIFWVSFDVLSQIASFQEQNLSVREVAWYYLLKTPELLVLMMPIALLLALLYSLTQHARHNELTAMRAAGLSLERVAVPYLLVGFVFTVILFGLNEFWVPQADDIARDLLTRSRSSTSPAERHWSQPLHFRNARDGRFWNIGAFNTATYEMRNPQVEWTTPERSQRLIARSATRSGDCWVFQDVLQISTYAGRETDPEETHTNRLSVCDFSETPEQIKSEIKIRRMSDFRSAKDVQLSILEILDYLRLHPDLSARDWSLLHTKLHERLAAPWTCLVVVLIALPFGALTSRRNVFAGVASSVFICFAFFVLLRLALALGSGGYIPPWMAAWSPNGVFAALGLVLSHKGV